MEEGQNVSPMTKETLEVAFTAPNIFRQARFHQRGFSIFMMVHDRSVYVRRSKSKAKPQREQKDSHRSDIESD